MDAPQIQFPAEPAAPRASGFVMVAPSAARVSGSSTMTLSQPAGDLADGRARALEEASRRAGNGAGTPRIQAEGFSGGVYTAVVSVPPVDVRNERGPEPVEAEAGGEASRNAGSGTRPSWMLVVAAEASKGGGAEWGGQTPWARSWIAPGRNGGIRMVPVVGDVEDRDALTSAMLSAPDDPSTERAALSLARKFGAPAVAEILSDGDGGVRAWLWRPGHDVRTGDARSDGDGGRDETLALLASLAGRPGSAPGTVEAVGATPAGATPTAAAQVDVEEHPEFAAEGRYGFAIVLASEDATEIASVRRAVSGLQGAVLVSSVADEDGAILSGSYPGDRDGLMAALSGVGVKVSGY